MAEDLSVIEDVTKKSGLIWLTIDDHPHPQAVWHVWLDGAVYVVYGGSEQPLPGIGAARRVLVTTRTKGTGVRALTWVATPQVLDPGTPEWAKAVPALHAKRLNAPDGEHQPARWAWESRIVRLTPTGEIVERPGAMPSGSGAAPPRPTPATTRGALPFVIGRGTGRGGPPRRGRRR